MQFLGDVHTQQINVMSDRIFQQTAQIAELHNTVVLLGNQLQRTQLQLNQVDARTPAFGRMSAVLMTIVQKVNEVITRIRATDEEEHTILSDLQAINMELAISSTESISKRAKVSPCSCDYDSLCVQCFH